MGVRLDDAMIAMIAMLTCCHVFFCMNLCMVS